MSDSPDPNLTSDKPEDAEGSAAREEDLLTVSIQGEGISIKRHIPASALPRFVSLLMGGGQDTSSDQAVRTSPASSPTTQSDRQLSIVEYVQEKEPKTGPEAILVLVMYAEKYQSKDKVNISDLRQLFKAARLPEPSNLPRDISAAVKKGYIYDVGGKEYQVTQTGMQILSGDGPGQFPKGRG